MPHGPPHAMGNRPKRDDILAGFGSLGVGQVGVRARGPLKYFMHRIAVRRLIAIGAAYAVALQVLLSGLARPADGDLGVQKICASASRDSPSGSPPPGTHCAACPLLCAGTGFAGAAPQIFVILPPVPIRSTRYGAFHGVAFRAASGLPQSRAPPAAVPPCV